LVVKAWLNDTFESGSQALYHDTTPPVPEEERGSQLRRIYQRGLQRARARQAGTPAGRS
jgi:hypothetical protein